MTISKYILIVLSVVFLSTTTTFSQESINDYKYVVIPKKYDFLKSDDQYQVNSLTKFLFNKYGFTAFMDNEQFPEDLQNNRCLALYADVVKHNAFLNTKLQIDLKDCNNKLVQSSKIGESREKEFAKVFNLALRDAFETFQNSNYKYEPNQEILAKSSPKVEVTSSNEKAEIERLKKELETLKEEQKPTEVVSEKPITPIESKNSDLNVQVSSEKDAIMLYAQPIDNGFQLVDSTPKVLYKIKSTSSADVFIVTSVNGTLTKKGNGWLLEYYENDVLKSEMLNIKF
jgi:hypothetical protein